MQLLLRLCQLNLQPLGLVNGLLALCSLQRKLLECQAQQVL
jgi:hypothetical protein